jgi:hypothetical protein
MSTIMRIALLAIDNDGIREDIQDNLGLSDEELIALYKYISECQGALV